MGPSFWTRGIWPVLLWPTSLWPSSPPAPSGTGTRMNAATFPFSKKFGSLYSAPGVSPSVDQACAIIEIEWAGIFSLWQNDTDGGAAKQALMEAYLVGWWLTDMYPEDSEVQGDGGMPLASKSIGGVSITRKDMGLQEGMKQLESNSYGVKAAHLYMSAPERMTIMTARPAPGAQISLSGPWPGWPS